MLQNLNINGICHFQVKYIGPNKIKRYMEELLISHIFCGLPFNLTISTSLQSLFIGDI